MKEASLKTYMITLMVTIRLVEDTNMTFNRCILVFNDPTSLAAVTLRTLLL